MQDIKTGNPVFDEKYRLTGKDENFVLNVIDMDIQHRLLGLKVPISIISHEAKCQIQGQLHDKFRIIDIVNLLVDVAERVDRS